MRLKLVFFLVDCDNADAPVTAPSQTLLELDTEAVTALGKLQGMETAIAQAMGVTQAQLDDARLDWANARGLVKPIFDAAGMAVARFSLAEAAKHFAAPEEEG